MFNAKDSEILIVAEGSETALAARYLLAQQSGKEHPAWATISANNMKKVAIPKCVKHVIIMGDNDSTFTGQAAAYELANRLVVREKRTVEVFTPKQVDVDWLDYWNMTKEKG